MNIQVPYQASCRIAPWRVYICIHNMPVFIYIRILYIPVSTCQCLRAQHTLVGRGLAIVEQVAHASFQRGPALEALWGADIVHEHKLLIIADAAPVIEPLLHCSVLTRAV